MLELKKITYTVGEKTILDNINIKFKKRKIYVVTGQNGSGKSTLAKIIMGILTPECGSVHYNGQNISSYSISERANIRIGMAFQQPVKFKSLTIRKLLELASPKGKSLSYYCTVLSSVGLCAREYLDRKLDDSLSGGERKRIELALTIASNCEVCIFDEPEAGIDLWSIDNLAKLFQEHSKGRITIIISHQERIIDLADELIVIENGHVLTGTKSTLKKHIAQTTCSKMKSSSHKKARAVKEKKEGLCN